MPKTPQSKALSTASKPTLILTPKKKPTLILTPSKTFKGNPNKTWLARGQGTNRV